MEKCREWIWRSKQRITSICREILCYSKKDLHCTDGCQLRPNLVHFCLYFESSLVKHQLRCLQWPTSLEIPGIKGKLKNHNWSYCPDSFFADSLSRPQFWPMKVQRVKSQISASPSCVIMMHMNT